MCPQETSAITDKTAKLIFRVDGGEHGMKQNGLLAPRSAPWIAAQRMQDAFGHRGGETLEGCEIDVAQAEPVSQGQGASAAALGSATLSLKTRISLAPSR